MSQDNHTVRQESCDFGHVTFVWDCDDCKYKMMRFILSSQVTERRAS